MGATDSAGRRVSYDKLWGALLVASCFMPATSTGGRAWRFFVDTGGAAWWWMAAGSATGLVALVTGFRGLRGRWRHFSNFALGTLVTALPLAFPSVWERFPRSDPARLPLNDLGSVGWVMFLAMGAIYAGNGIRVTRPSQILGQAMGALGALLLAVFAFLPVEGSSYAIERVRMLFDDGVDKRTLLPFLLVATATLLGTINLLRTGAEVFLAKLTRLLLTAALVAWIAVPILAEGDRLATHYPAAFGSLRLFGPLFLALDGAIAFVAISITRSSD